MPKQRSIPWVYRWSRLIMAGLATIGAVATGYLTIVKFSQSSTACPTNGCDIVLASSYATVFGLPLALFGFLAYVSMIGFAIAPLLVNPEKNKSLRSKLEEQTGLLLFMGATAMAVFSGYLMYLILFEIKAVCVYCVGSAILSASLFILSIVGRDWQDIGQLFFTGIVISMIVLVGTLGVYASVKNPEIAERSTPGQAGLPITTTSGAAELALADHLTKVGGKMYGAFWCPHCHDQKQLFGKEAFSRITYVECDPAGKKPQPDQCQAAGVKGYPTWVVNGQSESGTQSLEKLAAMSGYSGAKDFQNALPGR